MLFPNNYFFHELFIVCTLCSILFLSILVVRNSESRKANFILKKSYRLKNHALYELEAYTLSECINHCLRDDGCISVNYHKLSRAPRKLCVLNRASHTTNEDDLVADRDYMYGSNRRTVRKNGSEKKLRKKKDTWDLINSYCMKHTFVLQITINDKSGYESNDSLQFTRLLIFAHFFNKANLSCCRNS